MGLDRRLHQMAGKEVSKGMMPDVRGEGDKCGLPDVGSRGRSKRAAGEGRAESRDECYGGLVAEGASEGDDVFGPGAACSQREAVAMLEEVRTNGAELESLPENEEFDSRARELAHQFACKAEPAESFELASQTFQFFSARAVIHRSAVVGINEVQVPELGSLVNIRNTWGGQFEEQLRKRVKTAEQSNA